MEKKRLVVSYQNLTDELLDALKKRYPGGYGDNVIKVTLPNDKVFYAVTLDTADASYLVKVDVKIDSVGEEHDEKGFEEEEEFSSNNNDEAATFGATDEEFENIPDSDE
jgi:hypothetical protein